MTAVLRKYFLRLMKIFQIVVRIFKESGMQFLYTFFVLNRRDEMQRIVKDLFELFNTEDRKMSKEQRRRSSVALANSAFEEMDANADGMVTKEEFMNAVRSHDKISNMLALKIVDIFVTSDDNEEIEEEPV